MEGPPSTGAAYEMIWYWAEYMSLIEDTTRHSHLSGILGEHHLLEEDNGKMRLT